MKLRIYLICFVSGFLVLLFEILAGRILAPVFGNTILSWTGSITTVMLGLGLGYGFGAQLVKTPKLQPRWQILLILSALVASLIPWVGNRLVNLAAAWVPTVLTPLIACCLLFAPLFILLAAIPTVAVQLLATNPRLLAGRIAGWVFAISTLGSLCGALMTGYLFIPNFPVSTIIKSGALTLAALAAWEILITTTHRRKHISAIAVIGIVGIALTPQITPMPRTVVWQSQNLYQKHLVKEQDGNRQLYLDRSLHGMMNIQNGKSALSYVELTTKLQPNIKTFRNALIIGGGAYLIPRQLLENYPNLQVEVVEIDPQVTEIAKTYFYLRDHPRLKIHHDDGRRYLNHSTQTWDFIWLDAFSDFSTIPYHLLSQEFMALAKNRLTPSGILVVNTIMRTHPQPADKLFQTVARTLFTSFKTVSTVNYDEPYTDWWHNCLFVASESRCCGLSPLQPTDYDQTRPASDDYNPIDYLALALIK